MRPSIKKEMRKLKYQIASIEGKIEKLQDNFNNPPKKKLYKSDTFKAIIIGVVITGVSIIFQNYMAKRISKNSEEQLKEFIATQTKETGEKINAILSKSEDQLKGFMETQRKETEEKINALVESANTDIKKKITDTTKTSIEEFQKAIYPNEFEVALEPLNDTFDPTNFIEPTIKTWFDSQSKERKYRTGWTPQRVILKKEMIDLRVVIKNCSQYVAKDVHVSFSFEDDVFSQISDKFCNPSAKIGNSFVNCEIDPISFEYKSGVTVSCNKGFVFYTDPIEAVNVRYYPLRNIKILKNQSWMIVRVRNNYYIFSLINKSKTNKETP